MEFELGTIDKEELEIQIGAIEKLINNPRAMICLSEKECLSLENGLLNLLGDLLDELDESE